MDLCGASGGLEFGEVLLVVTFFVFFSGATPAGLVASEFWFFATDGDGCSGFCVGLIFVGVAVVEVHFLRLFAAVEDIVVVVEFNKLDVVKAFQSG